MKPLYAKVKDGHLWFGRNEPLFREFASKNPKMIYKVTAELPESNEMRGYFEGPLMKQFVEKVYLIPNPTTQQIKDRRQEVKLHFIGYDTNQTPFGEISVPRSTKGREALTKIVEAMVEYLEENKIEVPNTDLYKYWRDKYSMEHGDYDLWRKECNYRLSDFPREHDQ